MPEGPYADRINRVVDEVRHHLDGQLSLGALSKIAGFSPHHFHRIFKSCMGETLSAFVQRARLERAAYLMKSAPQRKLDSIAVEVGFSAHSDFTRVFKGHYGVAPSQWDRRSRLDPQRPCDDYEEYLAEARKGRSAPECLVRKVAEQHLWCVRARAPFLGAVLQNAYDRLFHTLHQYGVSPDEGQLLGWSWDNYETTPLDRVQFDFGFSVPERLHGLAPEGIHEQYFPGHRAVQVDVAGPLVDIALAWEVIYDHWLPSSGFEPADLPAMKHFIRRPDDIGWDRYELSCSIPLRDLGGFSQDP